MICTLTTKVMHQQNNMKGHPIMIHRGGEGESVCDLYINYQSAATIEPHDGHPIMTHRGQWNRTNNHVGGVTGQKSPVSQGRICSDICTCCHTEIKVADHTFSPSHSLLTPGQPAPALTSRRQTPGRVATGSPILQVTGVTRPRS